MSTVIIDATTAAKFAGQSGEVEVRTLEGRLVGVFTPLREATPEDYEWAKQHFTKKMVDEARQQQGGFTTAEALAHLRSLEQ
jgi:hypothetical protein